MKFVKLEIIIDEKWPVFTLQEEIGEGKYVIELDEDLYKQYLQIEFMYQSFQKRLKVLYDSQYENLRERCYKCFEESSKSTADAILRITHETSKS